MIPCPEGLRSEMARYGLTPPHMVETERFRRFPGADKDKANTAGWLKHRADGSAVFGDFSRGLTVFWEPKRDKPPTRAELDAHKRESAQHRAEADRQRRAAEQETASQARRLWDRGRPADPTHPYLIAKGIRPHSLRQIGDWLLVPMSDPADRSLVNVQWIGPNGLKRFMRDGRKHGTCCLLDDSSLRGAGTLLLAEGFATAASLIEATNYATVCGFDAGNLLPVAEALRRRYPEARIIICGDNDASGTGRSAALKAARAIGGQVTIPLTEGRDWNDVHTAEGLDAVRTGIEAACEPRGSSETAAHGNNSEWSKPRPILCNLREVEPFNPDVLLPEVLRDWIMDEAERMPCPPDFVAAAAIVGLGSLIGARCAIMPKARDSWLVVSNLWGGIVGDPSAKKSPAWAAAMRPLDKLVAAAIKAHWDARDEHKRNLMIQEAQRDAIKYRIKLATRNGKTNPANIAAELAEIGEPQEPVMRRYKSNDSTVEKLGEILRDNPAGVLVLRDELVGLVASWEREGREGDRAFFLEAWNGSQSFDVDRIGRGHVMIENLCLSIFGGIQPDKLTGYLEQATHALANDGMLQRFQLLVYPDHRPWEYRDRAPDANARDAAYAVFEKLAALDPMALGAITEDQLTKFPYFRFDPEAQEVFIEWSTDLHQNRIELEENPIIQQHLAKFDKLFPALALILHLVDCVHDGITGPVRKAAALRAAAWCEYLEGHARRCYGLLVDAGPRAANALADRITRGSLCDCFTVRTVRLKGWKHLTTDAAIATALDCLIEAGWLKPEPSAETAMGGRPTVRYRINPMIVRKDER